MIPPPQNAPFPGHCGNTKFSAKGFFSTAGPSMELQLLFLIFELNNAHVKRSSFQRSGPNQILIDRWGNSRWQSRWAELATCQQTKVRFPFLRTPVIRRLNRYDLGHLLHFTTGHNHLLRHRRKLDGEVAELCRLCGGDKEDALHLWAECSVTQGLGEGSYYRSY